MISQLLNTLFVQTPNAYVRLDYDTLKVEVEKECLLRVPVQHLGAIVLFGDVMISPQAMQRCAAEGREVTFLDFAGRFRCRVVGPTHGNVLLRAAQHSAAVHPDRATALAKRWVAAKVRNSRQVLLRGARDAKSDEARRAIAAAAADLAVMMARITTAYSVDEVRGVEGEAAARYFAIFGQLITAPPADFSFQLRTRRPPRDRVNAVLSFLYALITHDCVAATEGVGLDPQIGFLHAMRSGRPSLALDLVEEFRAGVADRLALTLINRKQLRPEHFDIRDDAGDSVLLNEDGRKAALTALQQLKQKPVRHPLLKHEVPLGLVPHLQARLLARHLRGELAQYPPFLFGG